MKTPSRDTASEDIESVDTVDSVATVLDALVQSAMYTGFNPIVLRNNIKSDYPTEYKRDIPALLAIFLQRGSRVTNAMATMSQDGKEKVQKLVTHYAVKDTGNLNRTDVSLPRIAAAFPELTVYILDRKPHYLSMTFPRYLEDIPAFMKVSCFASVIPNDGTKLATTLQDAHFKIMHELDNIINGAFADSNRVRQFWSIAFNSRMFLLLADTQY